MTRWSSLPRPARPKMPASSRGRRLCPAGNLFKAVDASTDQQRELASRCQGGFCGATQRLAAVPLALAMGVTGGAVGWFISRNLSRALGAEPDEVSDAVQRMADGDLATSVSVRTGDSTSIMAAVQRMQLAGQHGEPRAQRRRWRGHGQRPDRRRQPGPLQPHRRTGQRAAADLGHHDRAEHHGAQQRRQRPAGQPAGPRRHAVPPPRAARWWAAWWTR